MKNFKTELSWKGIRRYARENKILISTCRRKTHILWNLSISALMGPQDSVSPMESETLLSTYSTLCTDIASE